MIDEMVILETTEVMRTIKPYMGIGLISFIAGCVVAYLGLKMSRREGRKGELTFKPFKMLLVSVAFFVVAVVTTEIEKDVPTGKYRYECIVDNVELETEIIKYYNVVEMNGDVWVIEDM